MVTTEIQKIMLERQLWLAAAESCTGGLLSSMVTDQPGSSGYFLGGVVSYAYEIKMKLLGVQPATLEQYGAVSEQTAREMATGIRQAFANDQQALANDQQAFANDQHPIEQIIGVSITGIAGPGGGSVDKPVGLVWIGIDSAAGSECHSWHHNTGRLENKNQFALHALQLLYEHLRRSG